MQFHTLKGINLKGKRVLLRSEFNVPLKNGEITDDTRIKKSLPTIQYLISQGAKIIICAHLGRPKGQVVEELRLYPVAQRLSELLDHPVRKTNEIIGPEVKRVVDVLDEGDILLLENIRFAEGETKNDKEFAKELASMADVFVSDAFGVVHRSHASTVGVANYLPAYAGFLVEKEIQALSSVFENPKKPVVIIVAGAKMETKVAVIENFLDIADSIIVGGGIANTFLAAQGHNVGSSLYEESEFECALRILNKDTEGKIFLPHDVVVAEELSEEAEAKNIVLDEMAETEKILDMGEVSVKEAVNIIKNAGTVIWNGPIGVYEFSPFSGGTQNIAQAMAETKADTIVGGGDSVDAIKKFGISEDQFTHLSTGGGASLEFLEGKELPGVKVLLLDNNQ
ncbi:phosphoglycerate kinase [Candidatus Peregrinibacteria bacterium]|jgi:phosphoglycerate kinase|nr:phosphoglycerate kinase [Candidatus Peregrinibacteria bacterium]